LPQKNMPPVEDRIAIQDLIARYSWALDTGDVESFITLFTADAVITEAVFEDPDVWSGPEGVRGLIEHYSNSAGFPGRQHHVTQILMQGDSRRVTARSFAFVTECRGEPPYTLRFTGYYDDVIVKVDGEWYFKERTIRLWDGPVLARFPGKGDYVPRKRPPELVIRKKG